MKKPVYKQYLKEILMDKYGPSAFLFPDEMMFPVKNIHTGLYDCRLIQYAVVRALTLRRISHDFDYILEAAMKCFLEHGCKESVKITLTDTGEEISLISFLKMLDEKWWQNGIRSPRRRYSAAETKLSQTETSWKVRKMLVLYKSK